MMRAMYSGITGLKNFQTVMDIVGNNIANVNTVGFKASRVTFQTALLQTLKSGRAPQDNIGGTNPMQIGLGSQIASIDKLMTQGSFQNTGKKTDLAIQGDGFFILSDGRGYYYTRAGNFILDTNGTLIQASTGYRVQGWKAVQDPESGLRYVDTNQPIGDIVISAGMSMPARPTTRMRIEGNINSSVGPKSFTMTIKDTTTNTDYTVKIWFEKTAADFARQSLDPFSENQSYTFYIDVDGDGQPDDIDGDGTADSGYIIFNKFGRVTDAKFTLSNSGSPTDVTTITIGGDAEIAIPTSGEPKFYETDNPSNFIVAEYTSPRYVTAVQVYDTLGNPYTLYVEFVRLGRTFLNIPSGNETQATFASSGTELKNAWVWRAYTSTGELITYKDDTGSDNVGGNKYIGGLINFDESGKLQKYYGLHTDGTTLYVNTQDELRTISFDASLSGDSTVNIDIDLSSVTQFSAPNTANVAWQNGNPQGTLESFAINESGEIIGTFSNGLTDILGKIALAIFNNPAGLQEVGNSLYVTSPNSGLPKIGEPGTGGRGSLIPGALEMSNVDLAEEFTRMIIAQRGFQANARVITTADAILGELVALRR